MMVPYRPNTIENAIDLPAETLALGEETQAAPLDANTLPEVPGLDSPVPPLAAGRMPETSVVNTTGLLTIFTKSEPFQATKAQTPEAIVTPVVGPEPRITIEPVPALMTK
jgi:hypothetical protein